jgi:DNA-binding HxlR family transcriptional regulator
MLGDRCDWRYNAYNPDCPSRRTLDLIASKWTILIISRLAGNIVRYGELKRSIGGISHKMLTQTLHRLEDEGIISRTVHPVVPPHVDYALTPLGQTLIEPLSALIYWSEKKEFDAVQTNEIT